MRGAGRPAASAAAVMVGIASHVAQIDRTAHPGHRPLCEPAAQAQHGGSESRDQHRRACRARHLDLRRDPVQLAAEPGGLLRQQAGEHCQVLPRMRNRPAVIEPERVLHHVAVAQADTERQPVAGRGLGGQRLLRERRRVTRIGGNDGSPQFNPVSLTSGDGQHRQCVEAKRMREPRGCKPIPLGALSRRDERLQCLCRDRPSKPDSDAHQLPPRLDGNLVTSRWPMDLAAYNREMMKLIGIK